MTRGTLLRALCAAPQGADEVHASKDGWSVSFLEEDCKTSLPGHFVFQSELKILDLARHGGAEFNLGGRQAIEHGISIGKGSVWLKLTREQYAKLRSPDRNGDQPHMKA